MRTMRTFEYRLYPTREQRHLLMQGLIESRHLYNEMLETVKVQYADKGTFPTKYDLTKLFKGRGGEHVPATTVQMLADRLSKSLKRFLARKELGEKVGFPRFKTPNRWHSLQLRQYGKDASLHEDRKHLMVPAKIGRSLKIKLHRPIEGTPRTIHLVLRADGHWYALIVCETTPQTEHLPGNCSHPDIGIDVGLKSFLTDSEGYQHLAVEDLALPNMVKNHHLAKSILDASWGAFLAILEEKAERAGHQVIRVNPRFTSQQCSTCGEIVQKSLSVRTHMCPFCGYVADRDVNAAKNILFRARAWPSGMAPAGEPVELRSPRL